MSASIQISLRSTRPGCPPISCGSGATIGFQLKDAAITKGRDGSGWLIGTIATAPVGPSAVGGLDWIYTLEFPDSELSDALIDETLSPLAATDMKTGTGATGVCCLGCGSIMLIEKIRALKLRDLVRETFRLFDYNVPLEAGIKRLGFRNHSQIRIFAMEAAVESHAEGSQTFTIQLARSPAHQASPHAVFTADAATINPALPTPLTDRVEFSTPIEVEAGASVAVNVVATDPENHSGLVIHLEYRVVPESELE